MCCSLMTKVARAVHHAHLRGVLHRDLKPGNILLDSTGEPFLTDFGLAKLAEGDSGLTHSNALLGTPHYMSPEQAAGRTNDISTVSDVWALGVILYQMLSGRLPFNGSNSAEIVRRVVLTEAEPLTVFDSRAPSASNHGAEAKPATQRPSYSFTFLHRDLVTIVSRCLEKDPARRMHSAGFLADELNRFLLGEPVHSRPVSRVERRWKWARRHKTAVSAALTTGAALVQGSRFFPKRVIGMHIDPLGGPADGVLDNVVRQPVRCLSQVHLDGQEQTILAVVRVGDDGPHRAGRSGERQRTHGPIDRLVADAFGEVRDRQDRNPAVAGQRSQRSEHRPDLGIVVRVDLAAVGTDRIDHDQPGVRILIE